MSTEEQHRLQRRDREVTIAENFSAEDLRMPFEMQAPTEAAAFDHEMKV